MRNSFLIKRIKLFSFLGILDNSKKARLKIKSLKDKFKIDLNKYYSMSNHSIIKIIFLPLVLILQTIENF